MSDASEVARAAGLRHLGDDRPGIVRRRRGAGFTYLRGGRPIGRDARRRIDELVIPPAWRDVWIAPEADAHLQATGVDAAGRKQYLYHPSWTEAAAAAKFDHLAVVAGALPSLRRRVASDLAGDGPERIVAVVTRLIDRALIRPGGAGSEAVGATTLALEHVAVERDRLVLDFVGKSNVEQHVEVADPDLAAAIRALLRRASPGDVRLFADGVAAAVDAATVNRYLQQVSGATITAKNLRTWGATAAAVECLCSPDAAVAAMYADVADRLGNTVAVCRSSYVAPIVVESFESGELADRWRAARRSRWTSRAERTLIGLLAAS